MCPMRRCCHRPTHSPCTAAPAKCSTWSSAECDVRRRRSGPTIPTWPATSRSISARSTGIEEDEPIVAHPHDPFKRIDILASTRRVRIEWEGRLLAESTRPLLLFETLLPVRFYLPRADVVADIEPSDTISYCAYKGRASYLSLSVPDGPADVAWTYPDPLREAEPVRDYVSFFNERVDIVVDGHRHERPVTHWSD